MRLVQLEFNCAAFLLRLCIALLPCFPPSTLAPWLYASIRFPIAQHVHAKARMAFISHPLKPSHANSGNWLRYPKHAQHIIELSHASPGVRTASFSHPPKHRGIHIAAPTAGHQLVNSNNRSRHRDASALAANGGALKSSGSAGGNDNGGRGGRGGGGRKPGFRPHPRSVNNPLSRQFVKKVCTRYTTNSVHYVLYPVP